MTVSDTHADTIRDALFWEPTYKQAKNNGYALAALDALVAASERQGMNIGALYRQRRKAEEERDRERARAERLAGALSQIARSDERPMVSVAQLRDIAQSALMDELASA